MTLLWILLLGALHGLQPDHAAAAAALAARTGTSAWRAALRLAAGHALALSIAAIAAVLLPKFGHLDVEPWLQRASGGALVVLGGALLVQVWRSRYVVHAHAHVHGAKTHEHRHLHAVADVAAHQHRHAVGAIGMGLLLGLSGARSLAIVLPGMARASGAALAIALYCCGIAIGVAGVSVVVDVVRARFVRRFHARWIDLAAGVSAIASGAAVALAG